MDSEIRNLAGRHLCSVEFEVDGVFGLGASPLGELRIGYVSGGRFAGERLRGTVLPGGGNWSRGGRLAEDASLGTFDARAVWQTDDGALIYVTYTGRSVIPDAVRAKFAAPDGGASVDPSSYLLRPIAGSTASLPLASAPRPPLGCAMICTRFSERGVRRRSLPGLQSKLLSYKSKFDPEPLR
jgi:Protein of unknown function (DUF3237)